ncbi:MAG TPA: hypothetical protein VGI39_22605 [Polyangiaceae bacterium]|jgi:uncharacterized membrane protein
MNRALLASLSAAALFHAASSFAGSAAYDFKTVDYPGATQTIVFAINDLGQAVGQYTDAAKATHGFEVQGGHFTRLDASGVLAKSTSSHTYALNNVGDIAGSYADASNVLHGVILHEGTILPVQYPNGLPTEAYGVNDWGQVIGVYSTDDGNLHAFQHSLFTGTYVSTDIPGALTTVPLSINDRGETVGYYLTVAGTTGQGFIRAPDGTVKTYDVPGALPNSTFLISVNNLDAWVGGDTDAAGNVTNLLIKGNNVQTLELPASFGASYQSFQTINDEGAIVGYYNDAAGLSHGFLAAPQRH